MTISKEERAELRLQLSDEVPDHLWPNFPDRVIALLDALDASDARIASLEAEVAATRPSLSALRATAEMRSPSRRKGARDV